MQVWTRSPQTHEQLLAPKIFLTLIVVDSCVMVHLIVRLITIANCEVKQLTNEQPAEMKQLLAPGVHKSSFFS